MNKTTGSTLDSPSKELEKSKLNLNKLAKIIERRVKRISAAKISSLDK